MSDTETNGVSPKDHVLDSPTEKRTSNQAAKARKKARQKQRAHDQLQEAEARRVDAENTQRRIDEAVHDEVQKQQAVFEEESMRQLDEIERLKTEIRDRLESSDSSGWDKVQQFLHNYLGINVKLYPTRPGAHEEYINILKELEQARQQPLNSSDPDFPHSLTSTIYDHGLHIGVDDDTLDILWQVKVTPWSSFDPASRSRVQTAIQTIMDYTTTTPAITLNSSQKFKGGKKHQRRVHESEDDSNSHRLKKNGKMYAAGWHGTRGEEGIHIARYTVKKQGSVANRKRILGEYTQASDGFAFVGEQYALGLSRLFPKEYQVLSDFAIENHIPSFADLELWTAGQEATTPFANSLTITNKDFSNYVHRDRDAIDIAYGWWWVGFRDNNRQHWELNEDYDHEQIKGGEFLLAEYAVAVDFSKMKGLVEIFWRGKKDYHVTLASVSPRKASRFGTSIQITQSGLRGMRALEQDEYNPDTIVSHADRVQAAELAIQERGG